VQAGRTPPLTVVAPGEQEPPAAQAAQ
jgi:hypothetical protein